MDSGVANSTALVLFSLWTVMQHEPQRIVQALEELLELLVAGRIRPQVYARLPLAEVARAHELLESRRVLGSVVVEP
jgi:NADPH:quinone reductase-like Zn-dependent oxidoreductase